MRKVGPAPAFELLDGGLAEQAEGDFGRALTEVRAVSAGLDVCYGQGEVAQTELPPLPELSDHRGILAPPEPSALPPIDTEVESMLVGLDLPPPRPTRRRAASLLEQGRTTGEHPEPAQAERKA